MNKRYMVAAALAGILMVTAIGGCGKKPQKAAVQTNIKKEKEVKVSSSIVGIINKKIVVNSEIDSFKEVTHITETGGDIKAVYTVNGKWVKEGEKIMEFTNDQIEMQYSQAKAALLNAKAQYDRAQKFAKMQLENNLIKAERAMISAKMSLQKAKNGAKKEQIEQIQLSIETAKSNFENAKKSFDNNRQLYDKKMISEQQYLQVKTQFDYAENSLKSAQKQLELTQKGADDEDIKTLESGVKDAEDTYNLTKKMLDEESWKFDIQAAESAFLTADANLKLAEKRFNDLTVYSKIAGVIINLNVKEKNKVGAGTPLFGIINNDDMLMTCGLSAKEIVGIQKFNKADVYVESVDGNYEGVVYEVNPTADIKTRKYDVKIKIKNAEKLMKKGMYAQATIMVGEHDAMLVPKQAIVVSGINSYVFKVENGIAKKVTVQLGDEDEDKQEIISDEILEGTDIVVEGQFVLNDNDKVKVGVMEEKAKTSGVK